jgi:photosystem II stability/assembly factor-like uncharacterized protein
LPLALALVALAACPPAASEAASCRSAPGGGLTLANVATDGARVRAVGSDGLVAAARRLDRWRVVATPVEHDLRGVVFNGERWVVIGDIGTILARNVGAWQVASGIPSSGLRGIAARPGLVAASGSNSVVVTSADGLTWQQAAPGTSAILWGGTADGTELLLSGQESTVIHSADGVNWAPLATSPAPTDSTAAPRPLLWQLAAANGEIVAVGDFGAILHGTLAGGLTAAASPTDEILRGVAVADGRWVAVGSGGEVLLSDDGVGWRLGSAPTTVDLRGVAWTGRRWVAVGDQSTVISSADGRSWRTEVSAMPCALLGVAYGGERFVAVGGAGKVMLSRDGAEWIRPERPTGADLYSVDHGPGGFVAVGSSGTALSSEDGGISWRQRRTHTRLNLHTVFWTGDRFLAGGDLGLVLQSADGRHWQRVTFPGFHSVRGFATDDSSVIAAGAGTVARLAPGASDWDLEQVGFARFQTGVADGPPGFVVVGHNGEVLLSTDAGETWTQEQTGVEVNFDAVTWTGSRLIATGEGVAIASTDGVTWTPVPLPTHRSVRAMATRGPTVVGVGDGGTRVRLPAG